ncbi:phosphatidylethanolamine-binding protein [Amylocystis lapponica]|nr:phosphatidylethanolamine-binding protein [Amylocystis lapponica]
MVALGTALGQSVPGFSVADVQQAFLEANIIPDVLSSFNPTAILDVIFTDPVSNTSLVVDPGVNMTIEQTANEPRFLFTTVDTSLENQTFVLVMIDPDAPTPEDPTLSQILYLLAGDFHSEGNQSTGASLVNSTAAIMPFLPPAPPTGSVAQRSIQLLFIQPPGFDENALQYVNVSSSMSARQDWNLTAFSQGVGLGSPVAGNFFYTVNTSNLNSTDPGEESTSGDGLTIGRVPPVISTLVIGLLCFVSLI